MPYQGLDPKDPRRKTYLEMVKLVRDNRWSGTPPMFGNYLITAICWEESTFMNIPQVKGPARGFGQLEPSALKLISNKFKMNLKVEEMQAMMVSDAVSVEFVGRALHTLHDNLIQNAKEKHSTVQNPFWSTLNGYAGNFGEYKAAWREEAIRCWLKCADMQSSANHIIVSKEYVPNRESIKAALFEGMPPKRRAKGELWDGLMTWVLSDFPAE